MFSNPRIDHGRKSSDDQSDSPFTENPITNSGQRLYREARRIIPGGVQLLSKRPEMFAPERWPAYYQSAAGCEVIDLDGHRYFDFTHNGVGSCLLGYAHPRVTSAVIAAVQQGSMCSLNSSAEVELAKKLLERHPWAEQVRFARCGGEALSVAVRIARAATRRDLIAFCGYHGWTDWYLAANLSRDSALDGHLLPGLSPAGVPRGLTGTVIPFAYNQTESLRAIFREHGSEIAAVVMEPTRSVSPTSEYLTTARTLCDQAGARLIFDEVTTGFRFCNGGAHLKFGVTPDVAVFAKALGNGHPVAAVIGQQSTMEAAQESFISSTFWTESVGPAAAIATLEVMAEIDVPAHVHGIGTRFREICETAAARNNLPLKPAGYPALTTLSFEHPDNAALMTLFTVRMLDHGILAGSGFYPTLAHTEEHLHHFAAAAQAVFPELDAAVRAGDAARRLNTPVRHTGFTRLT